MIDPLDAHADAAPGAMPLLAAADLQDHLMTAATTSTACSACWPTPATSLMEHFHGASASRSAAQPRPARRRRGRAAHAALGGAITALQFQDMASQLIAHTTSACATAPTAGPRRMGDDEDGAAVVEAAPLRPNPVTQDEMDAGSVELF